MSYTVGGEEFKTKKAVTERARTYLRQVGLVVKPGEAGFEFINDLLSHHSKPEEKRGSGVVAFEVTHSPHDTHPHFDALRSDGTRIDFSYTKCVSNMGRPREVVQARDLRADQLQAYRAEVQDQVVAFREKLEYPYTCAMCGRSICSDGDVPHVDHVIPFSKLVEDFEYIMPMAVPTNFPEELGSRGAPLHLHWSTRKFAPEDEEYARTWARYHERHAQLRLTCQECNLGRGKGG